MKQQYITPTTAVLDICLETIVASSLQLQRGEGSGGNNAEVKSDNFFEDNDNSIYWEGWE